MASNNSKYTLQFREETARYVIESGKSAARVAEEIICIWTAKKPLLKTKRNSPSKLESLTLVMYMER